MTNLSPPSTTHNLTTPNGPAWIFHPRIGFIYHRNHDSKLRYRKPFSNAFHPDCGCFVWSYLFWNVSQRFWQVASYFDFLAAHHLYNSVICLATFRPKTTLSRGVIVGESKESSSRWTFERWTTDLTTSMPKYFNPGRLWYMICDGKSWFGVNSAGLVSLCRLRFPVPF